MIALLRLWRVFGLQSEGSLNFPAAHEHLSPLKINAKGIARGDNWAYLDPIEKVDRWPVPSQSVSLWS